MKRIFFVLGLCVSLALLSTSCDRECHCKVWMNNEVIEEYDSDNEEAGVDCSDVNTVFEIAGSKTGLECR